MMVITTFISNNNIPNKDSDTHLERRKNKFSMIPAKNKPKLPNHISPGRSKNLNTLIIRSIKNFDYIENLDDPIIRRKNYINENKSSDRTKKMKEIGKNIEILEKTESEENNNKLSPIDNLPESCRLNKQKLPRITGNILRSSVNIRVTGNIQTLKGDNKEISSPNKINCSNSIQLQLHMKNKAPEKNKIYMRNSINTGVISNLNYKSPPLSKNISKHFIVNNIYNIISI
jgi:hypothetical protein